MGLKDMFRLDGQVALVTGGSRGLGLQIAEGLGEMGARVAITARRPDELDQAASHLAALGIDAFAVRSDLSEPGSAGPLVDQVLAHFGRIDILVNNAGATWGAPAEDYPAEAWRKVMGLNMDAVFFLTQEVGRREFIPRRSGKILNVGSITGLGGNPPGQQMYTIAYNTSKGALLNFTRTLAAEWGRYDINVNAVCPGFFPTKMTRQTVDQHGGDMLAATPLGRLGGEEDLKGAAAFLVSAAARHITGQFLAVDGGVSAC